MTTPGVLVVDDEVKLCRNIALKLRREGFVTYEAHNGRSALRKLQYLPIRLMILDYMLTDMTGFEVLKRVKEISPGTVVYMLTAYGNIEGAVLAMKCGAADYFVKPIDLKFLAEVVAKAFAEMDRETAQVVFQSARMREIKDMLDRVVATDASVLLIGESGCGKSTVARWIHEHSHRKDGPFVPVLCASMPEEALDRELFGEEGKIAAADGGTLFLHEVGDLSPHLQAKLLKFLEERRFYGADPHGSEGPDVRLVTSSTRQLKALVHEGRFLRELYYHLNLVEVEIPPLRQRREDIPILIGQRMAELNAKYGKELAVSEALADRMSRHPWKGNIRELFNAIERMHLLKMSGELGEEDFRRIMAHEKDVGVDTPAAGPLHEVLEDVEERLILDALYKTGGNQSKAAEMLGISRNALIYRLKRMKR